MFVWRLGQRNVEKSLLTFYEYYYSAMILDMYAIHSTGGLNPNPLPPTHPPPTLANPLLCPLHVNSTIMLVHFIPLNWIFLGGILKFVVIR